MKSKLDKAIEMVEAMVAFNESVNDFFRELKHFLDTVRGLQIELIEKDFEKLKKYRYDSKIMNGDKLSTVLPIQIGKEEIERVLDEQDDALVYN